MRRYFHTAILSKWRVARRSLVFVTRGSWALAVSVRRNREAADALDAAVKEMLNQ